MTENNEHTSNNESLALDEENENINLDDDENEDEDELSTGKKILYGIGCVIGAILLVWQISIMFNGDSGPAPNEYPVQASSELPPPPSSELPAPGDTPFNPTLTDDPFARAAEDNPFADMLPAGQNNEIAAQQESPTETTDGPAGMKTVKNTAPQNTDTPIPDESTVSPEQNENMNDLAATAPSQNNEDAVLAQVDQALETETKQDRAGITDTSSTTTKDIPADTQPPVIAENTTREHPNTDAGVTVENKTTLNKRAGALIDQVCPDCKPIEHTMLELTYINQLAKMLNAIDQNVATLSPAMMPVLHEILVQQYPRLQPIVTNLEAEITSPADTTENDLDEETVVQIVREQLQSVTTTMTQPETEPKMPPSPVASIDDIRIVNIRPKQADRPRSFDRILLDINGNRTFLTHAKNIRHGEFDLALEKLVPPKDPRRNRYQVYIRDMNTDTIYNIAWLTSL